MRITPDGKVYAIDQVTRGPIVRWLPLGEGLYAQANFYTDSKFAIISISGGPKPLEKDREGYPGSAGTGENLTAD